MTEDMSDSDSSLDAITAHDIDELYNKVATLEKTVQENTEDIEGLHKRADIGITERAHCLREIAKMRADMNAENQDHLEWFDVQTLATRRQTKIVGGLFILSAIHAVWCLRTIATNMIKAHA
jgi:hypothetical protein